MGWFWPSRNDTRLAARLRKETRGIHKMVESTRVAKAFFKGGLSRRTYAEGLARIYPVYEAMETHLRALPADHRLTPFVLPQVFRSEAILTDLRFYETTAEPIREGGSTHYRDRVADLIEQDSPLLVAHAYVRYMADVSGGVIAGKVAARVLGLSGNDRKGLAFLSFNDDLKPAAFRDDFRARLNAFSDDPNECSAIVEEAKQAFAFNRELADELWEFASA